MLVDRPNSLHEAGPVAGVQQLPPAVLLHDLGEHDQLVVDALALLTFLYTMCRIVEEILALDLIDIGSSAERFERSEDRAIRAESSERAVVLDVFDVLVKCRV